MDVLVANSDKKRKNVPEDIRLMVINHAIELKKGIRVLSHAGLQVGSATCYNR